MEVWQLGQRRLGGGKIAPNTPIFKDGFIFFSQVTMQELFKLQLADLIESVKLVWSNKRSRYTLEHTYSSTMSSMDQTISPIPTDIGWQLTGTQARLFVIRLGQEERVKALSSADGLLYCYDERRGAVVWFVRIRLNLMSSVSSNHKGRRSVLGSSCHQWRCVFISATEISLELIRLNNVA